MNNTVNILRGLCAMMFLGIASCHQLSPKEEFKKWLNLPIPNNATEISIEKPAPFERWRDDFFFIQFHLSEADMHAFVTKPPSGYSQWIPLTEVYMSKHFFTRSKYPLALQCSKHTAHNKRYLIADPPSGQIYGLSWTD
ncbi:MAG: hypothetical protein M0Q93_09445 [Terrimicrobiaceae bacterium]|jgi:hypothetical protein|nr:hypothetical protein [Terrimicrobiaceae bacterium]